MAVYRVDNRKDFGGERGEIVMELPFGKYRDIEIEEVPSDYLRWLVLQDWFENRYPELLKEAEEELSFRDINMSHFYEEKS